MTKQEIFDKVYRHFIIDNNSICNPFGNGNGCVYHYPAYGTTPSQRCAVGILLTEEDISKIIENNLNDADVFTVEEELPDIINTINIDVSKSEKMIFLSLLQALHDNCNNNNKKELFDDFAQKQGYTISS